MVKDCQIWTLATAVRFHLPTAPYPTWTSRGGMGAKWFQSFWPYYEAPCWPATPTDAVV